MFPFVKYNFLYPFSDREDRVHCNINKMSSEHGYEIGVLSIAVVMRLVFSLLQWTCMMTTMDQTG